MIELLNSDKELNSLLENSGSSTEALKIRALAVCYGTKYDFCRFYKAGNSVLCSLNGSYILCGRADFVELAQFFSFAGFSDIFCSSNAGKELSKLLNCNLNNVNLMRFTGVGVPQITEHNTTLEEFYAILKTSFDIEFEPWYLDISHRIRHGVSQTRRLEDSVLVIQYNINGAALLSQIATLPESRGKGSASRLISAICAELSPSVVYVICENRLRVFYEHIGFQFECKKSVLFPSLKQSDEITQI